MSFEFIEDLEVRAKVEEAHKTSVAKLVQEELDKNLSGLKSKNDELLAEKKKIQTLLKNFDNIDPEKAREALQFLENNEEARLLKEGKFDELLSKKTSGLKTDFETQLNEVNAKLKISEEEGNLFKTKYKSKIVEDALREAAIVAGVRPEALTDVLYRGGGVFSLGEDGTVESRDEKGKLRIFEDDIILNPKNWVESLKKIAPHYWPDSEGLGAGGGGTQDDLTMQMASAASKGDMKTYRKLREKSKKK